MSSRPLVGVIACRREVEGHPAHMVTDKYLAALREYGLAPVILPRHANAASWVLVASGIPVLGWLTLHWGPMAGVSALACGAVLLSRPPLARRPQPHRSPAE